MIPYVISTAHPDYKRPYLHQDFGLVKEDEMKIYFLDKISEFILDRIDYESLKSVEDIDNFFDNYYDDCYMENLPWDVVIFIDGEWENVCPTSKSIWEHIQTEKDKDLNENANDKINNKINYEIKQHETYSDEEQTIIKNMQNYFQTMLDEEPLTPEMEKKLEKMDSTEIMLFILNKASLYTTAEKYKKNRQMFLDFLNISLKTIQKDLDEITKKLEVEHNEEESLKLQAIMSVYNNIVTYKEMFEI